MRTFLKVMLIAALPVTFAFAAEKNADVEKHCAACHSTAIIYNKKYDEKRWDATVDRMKKHGLKISDADEKTVKAFLYTLKK